MPRPGSSWQRRDCGRAGDSVQGGSVGRRDPGLMAKQLDVDSLEARLLERDPPPRRALGMFPAAGRQPQRVLDQPQPARWAAPADGSQLLADDPPVARTGRIEAEHHVADYNAPAGPQEPERLRESLPLVTIRQFVKAVVREYEVSNAIDEWHARHRGEHDTHVGEFGALSLDLQILAHRARAVDGPDLPHTIGDRERQQAGTGAEVDDDLIRSRAGQLEDPIAHRLESRSARQLLGIAHVIVPVLTGKRHPHIITGLLKRQLQPHENPLIPRRTSRRPSV